MIYATKIVFLQHMSLIYWLELVKQGYPHFFFPMWLAPEI